MSSELPSFPTRRDVAAMVRLDRDGYQLNDQAISELVTVAAAYASGVLFSAADLDLEVLVNRIHNEYHIFKVCQVLSQDHTTDETIALGAAALTAAREAA